MIRVKIESKDIELEATFSSNRKLLSFLKSLKESQKKKRKKIKLRGVYRKRVKYFPPDNYLKVEFLKL